LLATVLITAGGCGFWAERDNGNASPESNPSSSEQESLTPLPPSVHAAFGNISNATQDPENTDNFLVVGEGSVLSYNDSRGTSNWVQWRTTRADLGKSIPRPDFRPDPRLPRGFDVIGYYDYSGSGYDRGHMVPSADRFADTKLNEETFMMSNIVPQTGAMNQYPWEKFESYVRDQVYKGFDAYQIAGVYGEQRLIKRKVMAPTNCWKIVVLVRRGSKPEIDSRTRIIAIDMPNSTGIGNDGWAKYKTTVRAIEQKTGWNFFASLAKELQDTVETRMETVHK
jgi:endonuclease G